MNSKKLNIQDVAYKNFKNLLKEGIDFELKYLREELYPLYRENSSLSKIKRVKLSLIIPSQFGTQYENKNSKNTALQFRKFLDGKLRISNLRKEDLYPILVNINNNKIIDGNHRHYAFSKINSLYIVVLFVDVDEK